MNSGLYISASGALTSLYRQDVFTNNLANMDTVGFKPDMPMSRFRAPASREDGLHFLPSNDLMERLGGGVMMGPNKVRHSQGSLDVTSRPLDLAIEGDGFFVVRDASDAGANRVRLTRDGRFTRNAEGNLVMASTGLPVMDTQNRPIPIPDGQPVSIDGTGVVRQNGRQIATLQLINVPDLDRLSKLGDSMFAAPAAAIASGTRAPGAVRQGALEQSVVDEIRAILQVTSSGREVDSNIGMMQQHDRMTDRAINTLGRVS
jgi:flagellar basal-body rod protein FlgF